MRRSASARGRVAAPPGHGLALGEHRAQHLAPGQLLVLDLVHPAQHGLQGEGVAGVDRGVAEVGSRHPRRHGLERGGRVAAHGPLHQAQVTRAEGVNRPSEPRLLGQPGQRGLPVSLLVAERLPIATGAERAAAALDDDLVAALGEQTADHAHLPAPVWRSEKHDRRRRRVGGGGGRPAVGQQDDAVGHLGGQVAFHHHPAVSRRRQTGQRGDQTASESRTSFLPDHPPLLLTN